MYCKEKSETKSPKLLAIVGIGGQGAYILIHLVRGLGGKETVWIRDINEFGERKGSSAQKHPNEQGGNINIHTHKKRKR